jgi:carbamoylphosphate synthase large subunit
MSEHIVFIEASLTGAGEKTCQYARQSGREVTLVCKDPAKYHEEITDYVDRIVIADTNDASSIIKEIEAVNSQSRIGGITTTNDFYVIQTAKVAEHFGLPTTPSDKVAIIKNKYLMREAIGQKHPELNPAYALAHSHADGERFAFRHGFPFIAKPQDANDSLHVKVIADPYDLEVYFDEREKWGSNIVGQPFADGVLLEELIGGKEFCLDLLKPMNSPFILVGAFSKKLAGQETGNFIKIGASFPSSDEETRALYHSIAYGIEALGIKVGALNIDCKLVNGQAKILEINPRLVGDQMGSHMIELATGQNPAYAVVEMALGKSVHWRRDIQRAVAIHRITMPQAGYFYSIGNHEMIAADYNVVFVNHLGIPGQWYDPAKSNQDVVGSVIAVGKTPEDAMSVAEGWAKSAEIVSSKTRLDVTPTRKKLFHPTARGLALLKP